MSKDVLLTTLHLLGFSQTVGNASQPIDVERSSGNDADITVELRIGKRFEVNAIIGAENKAIPVWALDYKTANENPDQQDLWKMAIVFDESFATFNAAHDAIVELVDHLMESVESPNGLSNLENLANPLTT